MKKGMSELIASVLIIGFVIVLAAVLFSWQTGFFNRIKGNQDLQKEALDKCALLDIEIIKACTPPSPDYPYLLLRNNGGEELEQGFAIILTDSSGITEGNPSFPHIPGAHRVNKLNLTTSMIPVNVEIIPKLQIRDTIFFCTQQSKKRIFEDC